MNRILASAAAVAASVPLLITQCEGRTPEGPQPHPQSMSDGCQLYSNTLNLVSAEHLTGTITEPHADIIKTAQQSMLFTAYAATVGKNIPDTENILSRTADEKPESWTLKGQVFNIKPAAQAYATYEAHCAQLTAYAEDLAKASGLSVYNLFEAATAGAVDAAKPKDGHSSFMNAEEFKDMSEMTQGSFAGVGMEFSKPEGQPMQISNVFEGSPAEKAGVQAGDQITHVGGVSVLSIDQNAAAGMIKGEIGTEVTLTVKRGDAAPFDLKAVRGTINAPVAKGFHLEGTGIGVISIKSFNDQTTVQFLKTALTLAKEAHTKGTPLNHITIRVENNPGGLLPQAITMSDLIVDSQQGEIRRIVATGKSDKNLDDQVFADRTPIPTPEDPNNGMAPNINIFEYLNNNLPEGQKIENLSVSVLQNGGSASASEILAGAAQSAGIPVIGERSYGKGTVQTIIPLTRQGVPAFKKTEAHGALRLTTAAFFPGGGTVNTITPPAASGIPAFKFPSPGKSNLGYGIVPDIDVVHGDFRDKLAADHPHEKPGLIDPGLTRVGEKPSQTCTLVKEFSGALSPEQETKLPKQMVIDALEPQGEKAAPKKVRVVDTALACDVKLRYPGMPFVTITDNNEPAAP